MFRISFFTEAVFKVFLTLDRRFLACLLHITAIASILKLLSYFFPVFIPSLHSQISQFTFLLFLSRFTYDFVKNVYLSEKVDPESKAVFITGCDTGFGNYLARRLDSKGFHVFASCLFPNGDGAAKLKENCSERLKILGLDVTKDGSVKEAVTFVNKHLTSCELWAVVNNAGIQKGFDAEFSSIADFKDTMEVNAFGVVRITKAFLPLLQRFKGRLINVTSLNGRFSCGRICPYIMSKYAATGFTECIRQEMEVWDVRVIAVEPELFLTPLSEPSTVAQRLENSFFNLEEEIKIKYGGEFFGKYKRYVETMAAWGCKIMDPVTEALELAVRLKYPDSVYKPRRNVWYRTLIYFIEIMPQKLIDIIVCFVQYSYGLPTPKEVKINSSLSHKNKGA